MQDYDIFKRRFRNESYLFDPLKPFKSGDLFNDRKVKKYFDGLNLSDEQRDDLAERLCNLFAREYRAPRKTAEAESKREAKRLNFILTKLDELYCLLSTGLTIKQYASDKFLAAKSAGNIRRSLIKLRGYTAEQAAAADQKLDAWKKLFPEMYFYLSAKTEYVRTNESIDSDAESILSTGQLYEFLEVLYERIFQKSATRGNSQPTEFTTFAYNCSMLFGRPIEPESISKQLGKKKVRP